MTTELIARLRERMGGLSALTQVSDWLCQNTRHEGRQWSFRQHEFQIDIANDPSSNMVVMKPSQVGLSELSVRIMLALCAIRRNFKVIYVLPSAQFAAKFSKTRVDPVIEESTRLQEMLVTASNSAMTKRIGSSTMYMAGAASKTQAISIPAECLIFDEFDFMNPEIASSFMSRLNHATDPRVWKFSTPTLPDYGVDAEMKLSDQRRYLCKCAHCNEWQAPDFSKCVRIPIVGPGGPVWNEDGFEPDSPGFTVFTKAHLLDETLDLAHAYMACQKCHKDLSASLLDASRREWVPQVSRIQAVHGYGVRPFDLYAINTAPKLIQRIAQYADESDYWNFAHGVTYAMDDAQINLELQRDRFVLPHIQVESGQTTLADQPGGDLVMGMDVGRRKCHVCIGRRVASPGQTLTQVVYRATLDIRDGPFQTQAQRLYDLFGCVGGVIDIGPDYTLSRSLHETYGAAFLMASYIKDNTNDPLYFRTATAIDDDESVVKVQRTKLFNQLAREMNRGTWEYPAGPDKTEFVASLGGMKRISQMDKSGDRTQMWVKMPSIEDHYLHACAYMKVALDLIHDTSRMTSSAAPILPGFGGVTLNRSGGSGGSARSYGPSGLVVGQARPGPGPGQSDEIRHTARMFGII